MCLITLAYQAHPRFPLIVLANRDEFLDRPAQAAHPWPDLPGVVAGRDLRAGGTWLGLHTSGRFAALTNYRDLRRPPVNGPSRGKLVVQALMNELPPNDIQPVDGYNLIHGPIQALRYRSNITGTDEELRPGIHGLSNALLDTPWPKVERSKSAFAAAIASSGPDPDRLFTVMMDCSMASDDELPDTGLDRERERALSSAFIAMDGYGTRCSTLLMVDHDGQVHFEERSHHPSHRVVLRPVLS
jgi:uncharacterized protein with NRDE domain